MIPSRRCASTVASSSRGAASATVVLSAVWLIKPLISAAFRDCRRPGYSRSGAEATARLLRRLLRCEVEHEDRVAVGQRLEVRREGRIRGEGVDRGRLLRIARGHDRWRGQRQGVAQRALELRLEVRLAQEDGARAAVLRRLDERDDLVDPVQVLEGIERELERLAPQRALAV